MSEVSFIHYISHFSTAMVGPVHNQFKRKPKYNWKPQSSKPEIKVHGGCLPPPPVLGQTSPRASRFTLDNANAASNSATLLIHCC